MEGQGGESLTDLQKVDLLAAKLVWAMEHLDLRGSGMVMIHKPGGGFKMTHWTHDFHDTLERCGVKVESREFKRVGAVRAVMAGAAS
jgi:hypothetical protein